MGRLAVAGTTGLVPDEAYYWTWSRSLALGYFDHPPAIAWLIRLGWHSALGVRLACVVAGVLAAAVLLPHARDRWLLLALFATTPLFALGGILATPDVPLLLGWAVALAGAVSGRWWLAGLGLGLAGLGKLTGYGLLPLLALAGGRGGLLVAMLLWAPNLAWNAQHDWSSWRFQLDHGLGRDPPGLRGLAAYVGAQIGLVGPVTFAAVCAWWATAWRTDRVLWWTSFPVFVFFAFASTRSPSEPNWAAGAYLGAFLGLARAPSRAAWIGCGVGAVLTLLLVVHVYHPLFPLRNDPVARLGEGETLARSVEAWGREPIATERYQEAAVITYYTGIPARSIRGRPSQYDLTPPMEPALFVRPHRGGPPPEGVCDLGEANVVREGDRRWQVYPCR